MRPNAPVLSLPLRQGLGLQLMTELVAKLVAVVVPAGLVAVVAGPCLLEG